MMTPTGTSTSKISSSRFEKDSAESESPPRSVNRASGARLRRAEPERGLHGAHHGLEHRPVRAAARSARSSFGLALRRCRRTSLQPLAVALLQLWAAASLPMPGSRPFSRLNGSVSIMKSRGIS